MNFIWGHALMHFLSPVGASSDGLNVYLSLVRNSLLRVGRRGDLSFHNVYTHLLERLEYSLCVVVFCEVYSNTLDVYLRWLLIRVRLGQSLEGSDLFLRFPFMVPCLQHFRRGFQNGLLNLQFFPRELICLIHQCYQWSPLLFPGFCFPGCSFLAVLAEFCLFFPCVQGVSKLLDGLLRAGERCPGKLSPCNV